MSRSAIAFALVLAAAAANAQDTKQAAARDTTPGPSRLPAVASTDETKPFLFDGRMKGDGVPQRAPAGDRHPNSGGAIVVQPEANPPGIQR